MRYPSIRAAVVAVVVLALSTPAFSQTVSGLLQKGIYTEETVGDLDAAIKIYEQVVAEAEANRSHVAQAHYRLAMCYEKKGRKQEAATALQKLIEQFPQETEVLAQARAKLSALGQDSLGVVVRQVWANGASLDAVPSPDGKYLCYVDWESGDVAVREMATGKHRRLLNQGHPELAVSAIFSPDSKQVAYSWLNKDKAYELRIIGLDGTGLRVLYSPNERNDKGRNYLEVRDWSEDGKYILASSSIGSAKGPQIVLVSTVDGSVRVLKTQYTWFEKPRLSPDGRYVAYSVPPQKSSRKRDIVLLATDGSGEVSLVEHPADDFVLGWSSDGKRVVFASDRTGSVGIWLIAVAEGKPQEAAELAKPEMGQFEPMGLTTSGSFYYGLYSGGQNIYTATLDPATGKVLTPPAVAIQRGEGSNWAPAWSPDGRYLACLSSPQVRGPVFYIRSGESKEVRDLVPSLGKGFNVHSLDWSPDGRALLGSGSNEEGEWGAQRIDVQTGAVTTLVPGEGRGLFNPQWAANGKAILYTCTGNDARRLFRLDLETRVEQELYQTPARWAAKWWTLSPDGQQLAFSVGGALMVLPATGGQAREVTKGEQLISTVSWTPDGRYLLFGRTGDKGGGELWRVPVTGGEARKTELAVARSLGHLRVHPDGRQIAFTSHGIQRDKSEVWVLENFLPPPKAAP